MAILSLSLFMNRSRREVLTARRDGEPHARTLRDLMNIIKLYDRIV
jgi:hypothetical protein